MKDEIKLSWCKKHKEWYQLNCPECMAEGVAEEIFPKGYSPRHLQIWAETIKKELGYESTLSSFLRQLSENWKTLKDKK